MGTIEDDQGEPRLVCISCCDRHVLGVRNLLREWEPLTGEPVQVCSIEAFHQYVEPRVPGLELGVFSMVG